MITEKFQLRYFPVEDRLPIIVIDESESTIRATKIDITAESQSKYRH